MARRPRRLGELLIAAGRLDIGGLERALTTQGVVGGRLGTALLELGLVTEDILLLALSKQLKVAAASPEDLREIPQEVLELIPAKLAVRHRAVPLRTFGGRLETAMIDVGDLLAQDELSFAAGKLLAPRVAAEARVLEALERHYGAPCPPRIAKVVDTLQRRRYLWAESGEAAGSDQPPAGLTASRLDLEPPPLLDTPLTSDWRGAAQPAAAARPATAEALEPEPEPAPTPEERLAAAGDRDAIGAALLDWLIDEFGRGALFAVRNDRVVGWMGEGEGLVRERLDAFTLPFDRPSVFLNLRQGSAFHLGPLAPMPAHRRLARCWGAEQPRDCFLAAVRVGERLAAVVYGDRGGRPVGALDLDRAHRLTGLAGSALERAIVLKKQRQTTSGRR
jgi:hypothetical protein